MKFILRTILFSYLLLLFISYYFTGIQFGTFGLIDSIFVVTLGISIVYLILKPLIKLMSLPTSGPGFFILTFLITLLSFYAMDNFIPSFVITEGSIVNLSILQIVLNSYNLTIFWSYILVSFLFSFMMLIMNWLCQGKH